ncbi:MAG TPA: hypothetical protein VLQ78_06485 [Ornithinibacter sp.]|nr:hypothetical protein [Ornithinibacter sp.]
MPLRPDPSRAGAVLARLDDLRAAVAAAEDDVLACLVVTGEPRPQRVLDDWLDQVADTLRALGEAAADLAPATSRYAVPSPHAAAAGEPLAGADVDDGDSPLERLGSPGRHDHRDRT